MGLIDPKRILTPEARTVFEFMQLLMWLGAAAFAAYHFLVEHAQAATPPRTPGVERKVDKAINAINDLRIDMNAVMDRLQIPDDKRASGRHALPEGGDQ